MAGKLGNVRKSTEISATTIINKLYQSRTDEGLKTSELSQLSGVSDKTIRALEQFKITGTMITRKKIIKGLNKNPDKSKTWKYEEIF
jgi:DNA-binding XRE family transcriptional regulator